MNFNNTKSQALLRYLDVLDAFRVKRTVELKADSQI